MPVFSLTNEKEHKSILFIMLGILFNLINVDGKKEFSGLFTKIWRDFTARV